MDFNEGPNESSDNISKNMTIEKENTTPVDFIPPSSVKEAGAIDLNGFGDTNGQNTDSNSDDSFHSVQTVEDDFTGINIKTIDSNNQDLPDADMNKNAKANEDLFVVSKSKLKSTDFICDEENEENVLNDDSQILFGSDKLDNRSNPDLNPATKALSPQEIVAEYGNTVTDDCFDEELIDSSTNTRPNVVENSSSQEGCGEEKFEENSAEIESSCDIHSADDDLQTSIVDEADESFSLDEILEETECSDKDPTEVTSSNDDHSTFDENSMTSIEADKSESIIHEKNDESSSHGEHQSCENPSNNEPLEFHQVEENSICREVLREMVTVEENSEDTCKGSLPVIGPILVDNLTDDVTQKCKVSLETSKDDDKSQSKENSSASPVKGAETNDSSSIIPISSGISPSRNLLQDSSFHNHIARFAVVSFEEDDSHFATKDDDKIVTDKHEAQESLPNGDQDPCQNEEPKDRVPSLYGEFVFSEESSDTSSSISDIHNEKEALRENGETASPPSYWEKSSLMQALALNSAQESPSNFPRRVSSRHRKNSDGSDLSISDISLTAESDSSTLPVETRKINNHRTPSKSNSRSFRSDWQPQINSVMSAGNFSICLKKFSKNVPSDLDIKEEVIDESYGIDYATKERFNLVDFSIKLEKIAMDSDIESSPSPQKTRPALRRSLDNTTSGRSRSRSEMLRNRMRSRTATSRSRTSDRKVSKPSATTNTARHRGENQRHVDKSVSTRGSARSTKDSVSRANRQVAKKNTAVRPADNRRRNNGSMSAKNSTQSSSDHRRSLRSSRTKADTEDHDGIDLANIFNLRSRKGNGDKNLKGILVKPTNPKTSSKRVSFHLPEANASKERTNTPSKRGNSSSKSVVSTGDRKRNSTSPQSIRKSAPILAKKSRRTSRVLQEQKSESEDEVIDENPLEKLEKLVDVAKKTVDVWFECQCCDQKYYLLENVKQHVRTHFPNCLTN